MSAPLRERRRCHAPMLRAALLADAARRAADCCRLMLFAFSLVCIC